MLNFSENFVSLVTYSYNYIFYTKHMWKFSKSEVYHKCNWIAWWFLWVSNLFHYCPVYPPCIVCFVLQLHALLHLCCQPLCCYYHWKQNPMTLSGFFVGDMDYEGNGSRSNKQRMIRRMITHLSYHSLVIGNPNTEIFPPCLHVWTCPFCPRGFCVGVDLSCVFFYQGKITQALSVFGS